MLFSALYSALRLVAELIQLQTRDSKALKADVLALRQQVRVLERQVKRVRWQPSDRLILNVLRERLPRSAWPAPHTFRAFAREFPIEEAIESARKSVQMPEEDWQDPELAEGIADIAAELHDAGELKR